MSDRLKYINKIETIEAHQLASSIFIPGTGVFLESGLVFQRLDTVGLSLLDISDKIESKSRIITQKLTSYLPERFEVANRKYCFLITSVSGEQFLIGTGERPYPIVTFTDTTPDSTASKCAVTMVATYTNTCFYKVLAP